MNWSLRVGRSKKVMIIAKISKRIRKRKESLKQLTTLWFRKGHSHHLTLGFKVVRTTYSGQLRKRWEATQGLVRKVLTSLYVCLSTFWWLVFSLNAFESTIDHSFNEMKTTVKSMGLLVSRSMRSNRWKSCLIWSPTRWSYLETSQNWFRKSTTVL